MKIATIENLKAYIERGRHPGDFLVAVLSNNLVAAFSYADEQNCRDMYEIVKHVVNVVPGGAFGSADKVAGWMARGGAVGYALEAS